MAFIINTLSRTHSINLIIIMYLTMYCVVLYTAVFTIVKRFAQLACAIAGLTIACNLAAWLLGVPALNLLYNADLAPYLGELLVLVTGGGFLALAALATLGITIVIFQRVLIPIYLMATVATWALSNWAVAGWGVIGASWAYFTSMLTLAALFATAFAAGIKIQAGR